MTDERFAAYTRSQAFALALSQPMIRRLQTITAMEAATGIMAGLAARYDWYRPTGIYAMFGDLQIDGTERALLRRGLLDVTPASEYVAGRVSDLQWWEPTADRTRDVLVPSQAGRLVTQLLAEADFDPIDPTRFVQPVSCHPDDRLYITLDGSTPPLRRDRRIDIAAAHPDDARWMARPYPLGVMNPAR